MLKPHLQLKEYEIFSSQKQYHHLFIQACTYAFAAAFHLGIHLLYHVIGVPDSVEVQYQPRSINHRNFICHLGG